MFAFNPDALLCKGLAGTRPRLTIQSLIAKHNREVLKSMTVHLHVTYCRAYAYSLSA
jgi:hypothetical protein